MGAIKIKAYIKEKEIVESFKNLVDDDLMRKIHDEFAKIINPWVPMKEGPLSQGYEVTPEYVRYKEEYARYMYIGEVYGPNIPEFQDGEITGWWSPPGKKKHPTGRPIKYSTEMHPLATKEWDKVAMQSEIDRFAEFVKKLLIERHRYLHG